jgi:hypothetical protein
VSETSAQGQDKDPVDEDKRESRYQEGGEELEVATMYVPTMEYNCRYMATGGLYFTLNFMCYLHWLFE